MTNRSMGKSPGFSLSGGRVIAGVVIVFAVAFVLGGIIFDRGGHEEAVTGEPVTTAAPSTWTCSMHPQIRLPAAGKCPICFMDLIPLESDTGSDLGPRQLRMSEAAKQLAQIQTTPVRRAFAESKIRMYGKVAYDESLLSYITAWVPGRLDRLYADFTGVTVKKGDHLVDIYSPELLAAQEELLQAHTAVMSLSGSTSEMLRSTARATLEAAREKLRLFGLTPAQVAHLEKTQQTSDHLTIYAPVGGVVVHKDAREGMYVSTGTRIYTIADLRKLWVMFEAYESDLPWLRFGQRIEFATQSVPGVKFEALISFIDPLVDPKTRTVRVRAVVDNRDGRLKPDMFVRGYLESRIDEHGHILDVAMAGNYICPMHPEVIKKRPGSCDICGMSLVPAESLGYVDVAEAGGNPPLLIPATAPLITGQRAVVYVEIPTGESPLFEGREVELGPRAGDFYVVKSGVEEGELVVTHGAFKLDSELQIQAKPSMMTPHGGAPGTRQHDELPPMGNDNVRAALTSVFNAYFALQMNLAKDDLDKAHANASAMVTGLSELDTSAFSKRDLSRWAELSKELRDPATRIRDAGNIAVARDGFFHLSKATIELRKDFGHAGADSYYLVFCPMARDGAGAYWLQDGEVVWNSFWGAAMPHCGSVKAEYAPTDVAAE